MKYFKHLFIYIAAQTVVLLRSILFIAVSWAVFTVIIKVVKFFINL